MLYNPNLSALENYNNSAKMLLWLSLVFLVVCIIGCVRYKQDSKEWEKFAPLFYGGSVTILGMLLMFLAVRPIG